MQPRWKILAFHAFHVAGAAAAAAILGWLGTNQAQILAAVPAKDQAIAATAIALTLTLYRRPPGSPKL